jgi:hypothetical protein
MSAAQLDTPAPFLLCPLREIAANLACAASAPPDLQALLGDADAWQAEWLPNAERVLLEVAAGAAGHACVLEAWRGADTSLWLGDLLVLDGDDLRAESLTTRRRTLEDLVRGRGLQLQGCAALGLCDIVRAPSWRTLSIAHAQAPQHGARGLVLRFREAHYGEQPLVCWRAMDATNVGHAGA